MDNFSVSLILEWQVWHVHLCDLWHYRIFLKQNISKIIFWLLFAGIFCLMCLVFEMVFPCETSLAVLELTQLTRLPSSSIFLIWENNCQIPKWQAFWADIKVSFQQRKQSFFKNKIELLKEQLIMSIKLQWKVKWNKTRED